MLQRSNNYSLIGTVRAFDSYPYSKMEATVENRQKNAKC